MTVEEYRSSVRHFNRRGLFLFFGIAIPLLAVRKGGCMCST